ncbi:efflux RND transporter periplasmic adaptor subunit [Roseibium litorale]|uniref:Efflux RND transporter periplasmic adaptor subunit n=1 Tax=Roseibium litorale TaxID=2803841 RepID=A0ABR9CSQ4_9HYPH|nr:efflux RND transporter periplasmic adaptor subunit [Roseibium litorale]MBD8893895.1 efflux RND transporter periplasmic adaptor subunit [Roseibium litorale]
MKLKIFPAFLKVAVISCGALLPFAATAEPLAVVKVQKVEQVGYTPELVLTGEVDARYHNDIAFRVAGRISERLAGVGDHVIKGQILARLDLQQQKSDLDAARASVASSSAILTNASLSLDRQKALLSKGFTTRSDYDSAEQDYRVAQGNLEGAKARLADAEKTLDETILRAEEAGVITERSAEAGQVVQPGEKVFSIARDGDRDAVFQVYEGLLSNDLEGSDFSIWLVSDPGVKATGHLREISPTIDPATGSVRVKLSILNPPEGMTLGAPISGAARFREERTVILPWSSLSSQDDDPAVWVVDPQTSRVSLRKVMVSRYDNNRILLGDGLSDGEIVVTAGGQYLYPGLKVETVLQEAE